jgi:hypothetical protein
MTASWAGAFWRLATLLVRRPYQVSSARLVGESSGFSDVPIRPGAGLFPTSVAYFEISGGGVDGAHPAASRCRRVVALEPTTLREPSMG